MAASGGSGGKSNKSEDPCGSGLHCCEVCGIVGLSDDELRSHLHTEHVQDCSVCPFCDMVDVSAEVMMVHVNEAHLDYLSPQSEILDDSELYEDCMDTNSLSQATSSHSSYATAAKLARELKPSSSECSNIPQEYEDSTQVTAGGGAVSKRGPSACGDRSNTQSHKSKVKGDRAYKRELSRDSVERLTRSASNSPAHIRRTVNNLNEASAPIITIDDNCNLHVNAGDSSNNHSSSSSPSRSHLSLNLNAKPGSRGYGKREREKSSSKRENFACHRSNSTPIPSSENPEKRPTVEKLADDVGLMDVVTKCPICGQQENNPQKMERHINQVHFDSMSPGVAGEGALAATGLQCPLCDAAFQTGQDLELHVNITHRDILSPPAKANCPPGSRAGLPPAAPTLPPHSICARGGNTNTGRNSSGSNSGSNGNGDSNADSNGGSNTGSNTGSSDEDGSCPVCGRTGFSDNPSLALHIESHFNRNPSSVSPELTAQEALTASQEEKDRGLRRMREKQEFSQLQAQYGMDGCGSFKQQYVTSMERAVYSGHMTIADYYLRKVQLRQVEMTGLDDGATRTKGLVSGLLSLSLRSREVRQVYLCSAVDHYGSTYGDKGWGCGYRNIQMLLSALQHHTGYYERLFAAPDAVLSVAALQARIEKAWQAGFDAQGCEQLGGKLSNTRKWIGATELATLLSFSRIKCSLLDFHRPTAADGTHPELFAWCRRYFSSSEEFKPPLYLQHQGHSRTIIGVEVLHGGARQRGAAGEGDEAVQLLVLDPSHSTAQMMRIAQCGAQLDSAVGGELQVKNSTASGDLSNISSNSSSTGGGAKKVGYTCSGSKVVVNSDDWKLNTTTSNSGGGGGRGRGRGGRGGNRGGRSSNSCDNENSCGRGSGSNSNINSGGLAALRQLRRGLRTMKASQYQLVSVTGVMRSEEEYQRSKVLQSTRIPST